jgi:insulysin
MAVAVGSLGDPENREGLAHFLEHILSRGSKKFPDETEQWNYIASNGGSRNAYTAGDHTNYLFEVNHDAFDGALDRFADMFVAPILSASMIEREVNAVDSEFENNIKNDSWRAQQMFRNLVREDHPEHHFSIGNLDTLSGIERPEFVAFFDRYYSANQMALSLVSNASLDQLEDWARKYFSAIENKEGHRA